MLRLRRRQIQHDQRAKSAQASERGTGASVLVTNGPHQAQHGHGKTEDEQGDLHYFTPQNFFSSTNVMVNGPVNLAVKVWLRKNWPTTTPPLYTLS